ncbi:MAG: hypothetical protein IJ009_01115 [Clostridia bacterium]|nr:hypothetical protein [Clostridia bacterium]
MKHPGLMRFLYAHPVLAVLLPYLPALFVVFGLYYFKILGELFSLLLAAWLLMMLLVPVRAAYRVLLTDARLKLERDCDPLSYLTALTFMRRRRLSFSHRITLDIHYGVGLDAAGRAKEAYEWLGKCLPAADRLPPPAKFQLYTAHACAAAHYEGARDTLPALIAELDRQLSEMKLPPFYTAPLRAAIDTVRDAHRFYTGDLVGLRDRYVERVNACAGSPTARANRITACLWLARVYEREGSVSEARAMYAYIAENGGTLGAVSEAKEALLRLSATQNKENQEK